MIVVHHLENSRSLRIVWLLEELGVDYEIRQYARDQKTMLAPAALKQVHPLGKSPVITDEDAGSRVVAESGAIIDYLLRRFDTEHRLWPEPSRADTTDFVFWMHHAEASAMPPLVMNLVFSRLGKPPVPALMRPLGRLFAEGVRKQYLGPEIRRLMDFWEHSLEGREWFAGERFSAADIQMSFPLLALEGRGQLGDHPQLGAFVERCRQRPGYVRAVERGGELSL
ncbi:MULTISPECIES: glutathione S-transferase [unclassified Halomonas]|uniref:glutathione S-transferase family protein n=1 Tax=unclassified Halomonas TaxID=2609666 RepID=UPI0005F9DAB7|nr:MULTISPECIES: glutathione S-transferase [unclassified Halomonas]KJZ05859.1 glutathione S-transferase [Halomonas sp. S2151]MCJ8288036.1 glutathione S-transferase [Halomonas sp.]MCO7217767.1 glutathione S-transferase [Halomonas sp. OfavH-34-E]NQY73074.1 glutathione S-transferase [Halomonas sp.]